MATNWSDYSLEQLRAAATTTFRKGGGSRPDVLLVEIDGDKAVLKDQNGADKLFAVLVGPILNWRETKALETLAVLPNTPSLISRPSTRSFLMTYHPSQQINRLDSNTVDWSTVFKRLSEAIVAMHELGVAHNDLRNPSNILISENGQAILVDLVANFHRGHHLNFVSRWVFGKFSQVDQSAITKLKLRYAPELLRADDVQAEHIAGKFGMVVKRLGQAIRQLSNLLFTRKP